MVNAINAAYLFGNQFRHRVNKEAIEIKNVL
jgi:hypothetical protein